MTVKTEYKTYKNCFLSLYSYLPDGTPSISIENDEDGPIATITTCLGVFLVGENEQFVDTNNCPWAEEFIREYKLGEPTGIYQMSGYCQYPLYHFDMEELGKYARDD